MSLRPLFCLFLSGRFTRGLLLTFLYIYFIHLSRLCIHLSIYELIILQCDPPNALLIYIDVFPLN